MGYQPPEGSLSHTLTARPQLCCGPGAKGLTAAVAVLGVPCLQDYTCYVFDEEHTAAFMWTPEPTSPPSALALLGVLSMLHGNLAPCAHPLGRFAHEVHLQVPNSASADM